MPTTTSAPKELQREMTKENRTDHPVVQQLHRQIANAFVLYANYKHYHWQTFGPLFRDIHRLFDELAAETLASVDELAERIRMLGPDVEMIQLKEFQDEASVHSAAAGQTMREMIEEADANAMIVIREMRKGAKQAEEAEDPGTVDLFSKLVQIHEKHEWFLREILKKKDGLVA
jgi:starvation-inducible DNA-binding protein